MNRRTQRQLLAPLSVAVATALALSACGGGEPNGSGDNASSGGSKVSGELISVNNTEPQNGLIPTNTSEVGGGKILSQVFAGLVAFDAKGNVVMDQAEKIEPSDGNKTWTITLKAGLKFTNGEAITSKSFIDAWNYAAKKSNAQSSSNFFRNIVGFSDKKDSTLSGLKAVSDTEFTVKLNDAEVDFPLRLGYSAFVPMPSVAYKDMKAFGESPIGNGPYKLEAPDAWKHNERIRLVRNDDYVGPDKAQNAGLDMIFYSKQDAAYQDALAGNLDVLDKVPGSSLSVYQDDFPDSAINQTSSVFQSLTIPQYLEHFKPGKEGELRRQAISLAIDRASITDKIFNATSTPAKDFSSPVISGFNGNLKGNDVLSYNADRAKELWAQADKISKYSGTFTIGYNVDGDHESWVTAVANSISSTLGIQADGKPYPAFKQLLDDEAANTSTGAFRSGWQGDYPAQVNFMAQQYQTGAGANNGRYTNPAFDKQLAAAAAAKDQDAANAEYSKAQEILLADLPSIPLWNQNSVGVYNPALKNVEFAWNSVPLYFKITK